MTSTSVSILGKEQIFIGYDIGDQIVSTTLEKVPSSTYVLVTDSNISKFDDVRELTSKFQSKLNSSQRLLQYVIPPGELSKTRQTKEAVEDFMFKNRCTRDAVMLAVGGGVLGDMMGYVAATFMRGIRYVQIPTTLLAMVDSSIGGKTAVDTPAGKNLVGSFWQPSFNFLELKFLETLPRREIINGMAEVIKTAAIWNATEFDRLERINADFLDALDAPRNENGRYDFSKVREILLDTVKGSVQVKAEVVTLDECEGGLRNILNFGHSIGHAYEALLTPHVLHGECVSIGSVLEAELSRYLGYLAPSGVARLINCFKSYDLPVSIADPQVRARSRGVALPVDRIIDIMAVDKKNKGANKRVTLLSEIGKTYEPHATTVSDDDLRVILSEDIAVFKSQSETLEPESTILPPGSKSISNRVLILSALADGVCRIKNLLHSDDTGYMLDALQQLGFATVSLEDGGETLVITGSGGKDAKLPEKELYLGNAGTAARFLTALVTLAPGPVVLTGNKRMQERPIGALVDALRANSTEIQYLNRQGSLPVNVGGDSFRGGEINLEATVSSQYVSAILMVAPYASEPVTLRLTGGQPVSQFYIDMTIQMMADFGVQVERSPTEPHTYFIPKKNYVGPAVYTVESDASSSTYPLAFAALNGTTCTVPSIGSTSLQGDAMFAPLVLGAMGCDVVQTTTSTTVTAPKNGKLQGIEIDMEPMTDAFLTACVVASIADGKTTITGIANQRVKECDRIRAMHDQLAKYGVKSEELPDGIIVYGNSDRSVLKTPTEPVHSYDDHRVAMSLSLLATQVPGPTVIDDRKCVSKTWPGWWDTLHTLLHIKLEGRSLETPGVVQKKAELDPAKRPSIVLIGMRGAGKTSLGKAAAEALGFQSYDVDEEMSKSLHYPLSDFIRQNGWPAFRQKETETFAKLLNDKKFCSIIPCGGGIVETPESRALLKKFQASGGLVIHVHRSLRDIEEMLHKDTTRPSLGEDFQKIYERREKFYEECSSLMYWQPNVDDHSELKSSLSRFIAGAPKLNVNQRSTFVSLTVPDLTKFDDISAVCEGATAVEIRVDLLQQFDSEFVANQVSLLRLAVELPVIYTVRSVSQGGKFPDEDADGYDRLVKLGFRLGVEYIDIELTRPAVHPFVQSQKGGRTQIIASHHDPKGEWTWNSTQWFTAFFDANRLGDLVKLVGFAHTFEDNFALEDFRKAVSLSKVPFIGINMGAAGRLSRILNTVLTPVTHPKLPNSAAPGQLSIREINEVLSQIGGINSQEFFIFGNPVNASPSPTLHNTAFKEFGLPHHYDRFETEDKNAVQQKIDQLGSNFGGASVTIPLKEQIADVCDELSPEVELIGAVNTLTRTSDNKIRGSNTDWIGIRRSFESVGVYSGESALIFGAGGTACAAIYAFYQMGFRQVYIINRTASRAETLAKKFENLIKVTVLNAVPESLPKVVFNCVPATNVSDDDISKGDGYFKILRDCLDSTTGTVLDACYKPAFTPVMKYASSKKWQVVPGRLMLVYQGIEQFETWTGIRPNEIAHKSIE